MRVIFSELARQELEDAVGIYELEHAGLGRRFKEDVRKAALRIRAYPESCSIERGSIRKCLLHTFPYKLMYSIEDDHIVIIAVPHQHRNPEYWVDRDCT